jgi:hypothetical protein
MTSINWVWLGHMRQGSNVIGILLGAGADSRRNAQWLSVPEPE